MNGQIGRIQALDTTVLYNKRYGSSKTGSRQLSIIQTASRLTSATDHFSVLLESGNVDSRPLHYCGVEYIGLFKLQPGQSELKRYGCLFTCMQSRAVRIEIAHSLTTDSFIMALVNFITRWDQPEMILNDSSFTIISAE